VEGGGLQVRESGLERRGGVKIRNPNVEIRRKSNVEKEASHHERTALKSGRQELQVDSFGKRGLKNICGGSAINLSI
jgi:hypothetical protein